MNYCSNNASTQAVVTVALVDNIQPFFWQRSCWSLHSVAFRRGLLRTLKVGSEPNKGSRELSREPHAQSAISGRDTHWLTTSYKTWPLGPDSKLRLYHLTLIDYTPFLHDHRLQDLTEIMTTAPTKSTGLYANENGKVVLHDLPVPQPEDDELLIKVLYSGVNLSDVRALGFFGLKNHPVGQEFCGEVLESRNLAETPFKAGDIVAGYVIAGKTRPPRYATHQEYMDVPPSWFFKVPDHIPPHAAAALPVVVQTANDTLFNRLRIPLPPSVTTPAESTSAPEGTLVIWGEGATGVGMAAIQLARASRVPSIVAIASTRRHDFLKTQGATQCFDYHDADVVDKVKAALKKTKGTIWGFDALGSVADPVSQDILASAIPPHDKVRLATVLVVPQDGFEMTIAGRHYQVDLDLPDGTKLVFPKDLVAADRMWRALGWVVEHYGAENVPTPVRVFDGPGKDAVDELYGMQKMDNFGKVVLKHPLN